MHSKGRPLSPHITIYKPQVSSVMSILHRITGVVNFIGVSFLVWWVTIIGINGFVADGTFIWDFLSGSLGIIFLMSLSFSIIFHMCTGIRHLLWDAGFGFHVDTFPKTAAAALIASAMLFALLWVLIYFARP